MEQLNLFSQVEMKAEMARESASVSPQEEQGEVGFTARSFSSLPFNKWLLIPSEVN